MKPETRGQTWAVVGLEAALGLLVGLAVWWLWPRLRMPMLGHEAQWFGLGWALTLAAPSFLRLWEHYTKPRGEAETLSPEVCAWGSLLLGLLFVALLMGAAGLGNYKLWLGAVYLAAVTLRLAGVALGLRRYLLTHPQNRRVSALVGGAIGLAAALLMLPWVSPELVAVWPPSPSQLAEPLLRATLWAVVTGSMLAILPASGVRPRLAWMAYLALCLGAGPALALAWFDLLYLGIAAAALVLLAALAIWREHRQQSPVPDYPQPLPVYWLLRAFMLLWWGAGMAVTLSSAWWQPRVGQMLIQADWLRALLLGMFLISCAGLLAEYSLPLISRQAGISGGRERKLLGVLLSSLALLAATAPVLLTAPPEPTKPLALDQTVSRAELLDETVVLSPDNPEVVITVPGWLRGITRVHMVSLLRGAEQVGQGESVAQLAAVDDLEVPHTFHIRAGVDTAQWNLEKTSVQAKAEHQTANISHSWVMFTPEGEAFQGHDYYTGLYLGRKVGGLQKIMLRYWLQPGQSGQAPLLEVRRLFVE